MQGTTVLIAGATGYLGGYVARELKKQNYFTCALVRNAQKLADKGIPADQVIQAPLTDKHAIADCCNGIDVVFSSVGITRQKDNLTYMDVDYQANLNLLEAARRSGVKLFIYVSVLNGDKMQDLKICAAKEKFVAALKNSGLNYCVMRPSGFFSDMGEFYKMVKKGRAFLFGNGQQRSNPIHGEDLARVCVDAIKNGSQEICVGGPEILTQEQIANIAFNVTGNKKKITYIPAWTSKLLLFVLRTFTSSKTYGPIELFLTALYMDLVAPVYGTHTLQQYFETLKAADSAGH